MRSEINLIKLTFSKKFSRFALTVALFTNILVAQAECLQYEPIAVTLSGKLERKAFPGPPNYESVAEGDKPETGYYLALPLPICTVGQLGSTNSESHNNVSMIQLVLNQESYTKLRPLLGKNIHVQGSLFEWFNGHHHTPLLLKLQNIENEHSSTTITTSGK